MFSHIVNVFRDNYKKLGLLKTLNLYFFVYTPELLYFLFLKVRGDSFIFNNKRYKYFYHLYNVTWKNERCIEIPIIESFIRDCNPRKLLEFGNVLKNYNISVPEINKHIVLDKYEIAKGVINEDIVNFNTSEKFDTIVSISTLEHVGWDEEVRDSAKVLKGFRNLLNLKSKTGKLIITFPFGYNPYLDNALMKKDMKFEEIHAMCFSRRLHWH